VDGWVDGWMDGWATAVRAFQRAAERGRAHRAASGSFTLSRPLSARSTGMAVRHGRAAPTPAAPTTQPSIPSRQTCLLGLCRDRASPETVRRGRLRSVHVFDRQTTRWDLPLPLPSRPLTRSLAPHPPQDRAGRARAWGCRWRRRCLDVHTTLARSGRHAISHLSSHLPPRLAGCMALCETGQTEPGPKKKTSERERGRERSRGEEGPQMRDTRRPHPRHWSFAAQLIMPDRGRC